MTNLAQRRKSPFGIIVAVFAIVAAILVLVTQMAAQRADDTLLRRYCGDPDYHVALVEKILTKSDPAGKEKRRPYIVAAKLLYIVQQNANEPVQSYLERLRITIISACQ